MAGILKVDKYQDFNGNDIMTSDGSGNLTLNNAAMKMTPAFEASLSANQTVGDSADVKVQFNTETFDTDNCYDNSTNYRFTPTVAGKYFVYVRIQCDSNAANNLQQGFAKIYKNGSRYSQTQMNMNGNFPENIMVECSNIIDMNGSSDYLEGYVNIDDTSGDGNVRGTTSYVWTCFGAYKIIGA